MQGSTACPVRARIRNEAEIIFSIGGPEDVLTEIAFSYEKGDLPLWEAFRDALSENPPREVDLCIDSHQGWRGLSIKGTDVVFEVQQYGGRKYAEVVVTMPADRCVAALTQICTELKKIK